RRHRNDRGLERRNGRRHRPSNGPMRWTIQVRGPVIVREVVTRTPVFLVLSALLGGCAFQAGGLSQPLNPVVASLGQREPEVPYVPTPAAVVDAMLDMAEVGSGDYLIDLGSGDGRIVIA